MDPDCPYVSRGGLKLAHALREFAVDPTGLRCADFGCSTGGFTDCLLQHGAKLVVSIDTGYGQLAWKLRKDPRVIVKERSNALHLPPPATPEIDLIVVDLGWTKQKLLIPVALKWLVPAGRIITLIKPHYEQEGPRRDSVVLEKSEAFAIVERVAREIPAMGASVLAITESPVLGGAKSGSKSKGTGNTEWLALLTPTQPGTSTPPLRPPG
ncbi:MAG: TlyA family RNA methyltransferase [Phycisphaerales bacterium]